MDVLAIDCSNLGHRAYFANSQRFERLFMDWVDKLKTLYAVEQKAEVLIAFDSAVCVRRELYPAYKAGRSEKHPDLAAWLEKMRGLYPAPDGFEADDLIASRVARVGDTDQAVMVSGDLDLCALVAWNVRLVRPPAWSEPWGPDDVYGKFGVWPDQVPAYKALCGDGSDNIKGVAGIGPVKAKSLLETHGTFEGVLTALTPDQQGQARLAYELVRLKEDAPL